MCSPMHPAPCEIYTLSYTTLFRSAFSHLRVEERQARAGDEARQRLDQRWPIRRRADHHERPLRREECVCRPVERGAVGDRKSTCLNSSHVKISYAVFCLKKKHTIE